MPMWIHIANGAQAKILVYKGASKALEVLPDGVFSQLCQKLRSNVHHAG